MIVVLSGLKDKQSQQEGGRETHKINYIELSFLVLATFMLLTNTASLVQAQSELGGTGMAYGRLGWFVLSIFVFWVYSRRYINIAIKKMKF